MANYTNDMAAVEARPIDLTPGDMVSGDEVREHGARITHSANSPDRDDPTFTVRAVRFGGGSMVVLDAGDAGEYVIDAFVELTVQPVICADCGHSPTDCECEETDMSKRVIEVEALRQVAFPGFPYFRVGCDERALDAREEVEWTCDRNVGHEGPHMGTYEYDGEGTIIGFAWTEEEN